MYSKITLLAATMLMISACTSTPKAPEVTADEETYSIPRGAAAVQSRLGMIRAANDLGYAERRFNPCEHGLAPGPRCDARFMTVVHFQLLCRDSEGTVSSVPTALRPLNADRVVWKLAGHSGGTRTDSEGYGQLTMISNRSTRGQRLILLIGKQFLGVTASKASRLVLPDNFCGQRSPAEKI